MLLRRVICTLFAHCHENVGRAAGSRRGAGFGAPPTRALGELRRLPVPTRPHLPIPARFHLRPRRGGCRRRRWGCRAGAAPPSGGPCLRAERAHHLRSRRLHQLRPAADGGRGAGAATAGAGAAAAGCSSSSPMHERPARPRDFAGVLPSLSQRSTSDACPGALNAYDLRRFAAADADGGVFRKKENRRARGGRGASPACGRPAAAASTPTRGCSHHRSESGSFSFPPHCSA